MRTTYAKVMYVLQEAKEPLKMNEIAQKIGHQTTSSCSTIIRKLGNEDIVKVLNYGAAKLIVLKSKERLLEKYIKAGRLNEEDILQFQDVKNICPYCKRKFEPSKFASNQIICGSNKCRHLRRIDREGREQLREKQRKWAKENKEHIRKYKREYWKKNEKRIKLYREKNREDIRQKDRLRKLKYKNRFLDGGWKTDEIKVSSVDKDRYVVVEVGKYFTLRHIINWARANGRLPEKGKHIHHINGELIWDEELNQWAKNDNISNLEERPHAGVDHDNHYIGRLKRENELLMDEIKKLRGELNVGGIIFPIGESQRDIAAGT